MDFCDNNFLKVYEFLGIILLILKCFVPMIIIIMGTYDLFQAVVKNEESILKKKFSVLLKRIVAGVFIFFIPNLVLVVFDSLLPQNNAYSCMYYCVLDRKCNTSNGNSDNIVDSNICSALNENQCGENYKCIWIDMSKYGSQFNNPQTNNYHCAIK